jgi:hypothetical protein
MSYRSIICATNIFAIFDDCLPFTDRLYRSCTLLFPFIPKIVVFCNLLCPAFSLAPDSNSAIARFSKITAAIL